VALGSQNVGSRARSGEFFTVRRVEADSVPSRSGVVDWDVRYIANDDLRQYRITMIKDHPRRVEVSDDEPCGDERGRGVTATVCELDRDFRSLRLEDAPIDVALIFALYLRQYPTIEIVYNGTHVNPSVAEEATASYDLPPIKTYETFSVALEIVEWRGKTQRRLYFCDTDGFPVDETAPGVHAPGFEFTAYL
jgi:hypothetical protein